MAASDLSPDPNSNGWGFYDAYPSRNSRRAAGGGVNGYFENLVQYVGAGFLPTEDVRVLCQKNFHDGGVFLFTEAEHERITRVNF